jgi:hypothetical protein
MQPTAKQRRRKPMIAETYARLVVRTESGALSLEESHVLVELTPFGEKALELGFTTDRRGGALTSRTMRPEQLVRLHEALGAAITKGRELGLVPTAEQERAAAIARSAEGMQ